MTIPVSGIIINQDILAEDIFVGSALLAKSGTLLTKEAKRGLAAFGIQIVKIQK